MFPLTGLLFVLGLAIRLATENSVYPDDSFPRRVHILLVGFYSAWVIPVIYFTAGILLVVDDIVHFFCTPKPKKKGLSLEDYKKLLPVTTASDINVQTINIREHGAEDVKLSEESTALVTSKFNPAMFKLN